MFMGIDPGQSGGIAAIDSNGTLIARPMPWMEKQGIDGAALKRILKQFPPTHVFIEAIQQRKGEGAVSGKTAATQWGRVIGMLEMAGIPYDVVQPLKWRKAMDCGIPSGGDQKDRRRLLKARSMSRVAQLWPNHDFRRTPKCSKPHEGMGEAALIAEYGRRIHGNGQ